MIVSHKTAFSQKDDLGIRVMLVEDHAIVLTELQKLLGRENDITLVGMASSGREALDKAGELAPDVLILDLILPDMGGVLVMRKLLSEYPQFRVLVLSTLQENDCIVESLAVGARGYLTKECMVEELPLGIRAVYAGRSYLCTTTQKVLAGR